MSTRKPKTLDWSALWADFDKAVLHSKSKLAYAWGAQRDWIENRVEVEIRRAAKRKP